MATSWGLATLPEAWPKCELKWTIQVNWGASQLLRRLSSLCQNLKGLHNIITQNSSSKSTSSELFQVLVTDAAPLTLALWTTNVSVATIHTLWFGHDLIPESC